jgi:hypothetical protein
MARSDYIYVMTRPEQIEPVATFTVKRELRAYLIQLDRQDSPLLSCRLFRMADGQGGLRAEMGIRDVIDGK